MRALVIAPQPFFSPRGTPFSVYYRTLVTSELGIDVDLLTYGEGEDVDIPRVHIYRIPRFAFLGPVKVGPSLLKLFLDLWLGLWTVALLLRRRYDFVHAHEEAVFYCRFLKPIFRFKLVYDMHSSLPQQLGNFRFTTSRVLVGAFEKLEQTALRHADAVITICPALADYALGHMNDDRKHLLIENSIFDTVRLAKPARSSNGADVRARGEEPKIPSGRPILLYAGTLEPYQGIDVLLRGFALARRQVSDAFLLVVGGSAEQIAEYESLARDLCVSSHCLFTGRVPHHMAKAYLKNATALLSPRLTGTNTPLKIYEQLASGLPLLATDIFAHTQVLSDEVAFLVKPDAESLARGLVAMLTDRALSKKKAAAALNLYEEKYSRARYVGKMRALLEVLA